MNEVQVNVVQSQGLPALLKEHANVFWLHGKHGELGDDEQVLPLDLALEKKKDIQIPTQYHVILK